MRNRFIKTLEDLAAGNEDVVFITNDLGYNVIERFAEKFPKQFVNAGVAEQNMTGMAAGMALAGKTVFTYSIANFPSLRPFEQVRNDICYHKANVKIVSIGAGFGYGQLGATHHATEDMAAMRALPNMTIISPADASETELAARAVAAYPGPCYLRLGKDYGLHEGSCNFAIGKAEVFREGSDITLISTGGVLKEALEAAAELEKEGVSARVINMHTLKPLDREAIERAAAETKGIVTVEEHSVIGGLGGAVAEVVAELGGVPMRRVGVADTFSSWIGDNEFLKEKHGISASVVVEQARTLLRGIS